MRKPGILMAMGAALILSTGCAAKLSQEDRELMNRAIEASKDVTAPVERARAAADRSEQAAKEAKDAAARAGSAADRAERAASQAAQSASNAESAAQKATKAFEMGLKK